MENKKEQLQALFKRANKAYKELRKTMDE